MSKRSRRFDDSDYQPDHQPEYQPEYQPDHQFDDQFGRQLDDHPVLRPDHRPELEHARGPGPGDLDRKTDESTLSTSSTLSTLSTYVDAATGPSPVPPWVITSGDAVDVDLGVLKSGKEADVSLLRRSHAGHESLMAVKRYRSAEHRMFHRDSGYLEGRRERRSRESRAMATRTEFGRELIAGKWAAAEFDVLCRLWAIGAPVPYPVQMSGTEVMMEFIGTGDGVAAPRLASIRPDRRTSQELFAQMRDVLRQLTDAGFAHGDLSPYNVLVDENDSSAGDSSVGRLVLIDLPQAVDLVGNPQGFTYLRRDCENICSWFNARGVDTTAAELEADLLQTFGPIVGLGSPADADIR